MKEEGENLFGLSFTENITFPPPTKRFVDYMLRQYRLEMLAIFVEPLSVIMLLLMILTEYWLSPILEGSFKDRGGALRFGSRCKSDNDAMIIPYIRNFQLNNTRLDPQRSSN